MMRSGSEMRRGRRVRMGTIVVAATVVVFSPPGAATQGVGSTSNELRVFTTRSIATVLEKIGADFERRTGRKLNVTTDVAVRMVRRINDGERFDFLVAAPAQIDELIRAGKIIPETRTDLARSGIGVAVRAGAPRPDVSSVDAFKRALLTARSIAYLKEGQSGVYVAGVLERLGIAETIRSKVTLPETDIVSELVRRGEIELGIVVITQIVTTAGVALAGPLPSDIQSYITFTGGISASNRMFVGPRFGVRLDGLRHRRPLFATSRIVRSGPARGIFAPPVRHPRRAPVRVSRHRCTYPHAACARSPSRRISRRC